MRPSTVHGSYAPTYYYYFLCTIKFIAPIMAEDDAAVNEELAREEGEAIDLPVNH
jgi:hypothetical protein